MAFNQLKTPTQSDNPLQNKPSTSREGTGKRGRSRAVSEYKKSLQEKQTLKRLYGLSEKQFKRYVKEALDSMQKVENISDELVKKLEKRLDNVIFRLGFAKSRSHARQLVVHAYFLVNGKSVNVPSFQVKKRDIVTIKPIKKNKLVFKDLPATLKKAESPEWLSLDKENFEGKVVGEPSLAVVNLPVEVSLIFEFYSR